MYGDHQVVEVRRLLLDIPGVDEVYASSSFQVVEVEYDPAQVNDLEIACKLEDAGYLGDWGFPKEAGRAAYLNDADQFFRHTAVYETTRGTVSFKQTVPYTGRPLWTCPGMGALKTMEE